MKNIPLKNDVHEFEKINSFTVMEYKVEIHKCKKCGLTGRKYGTLSFLFCDPEQPIVACTHPAKQTARFVRTKKK
jgi:hypothetical protein